MFKSFAFVLELMIYDLSLAPCNERAARGAVWRTLRVNPAWGEPLVTWIIPGMTGSFPSDPHTFGLEAVSSSYASRRQEKSGPKSL